jgi:hypothetical protein
VTALDVGLVTTTTPTRRVGEWLPGRVILTRPHCPNPIEVTALGRPYPGYLCGCGRCNRPPPPTCVCGDRGTHRPEPGVGCTRPGCLCLEPGEPAPPAVPAPPNPGRVVRR